MFSLDFHDHLYAKATSTSPLIFIVGVRGIETHDDAINIATVLKEIFDTFNVPFIYKNASSEKNDIFFCLDRLKMVRENVHIPVAVQITEPRHVALTVPFTDVLMLTAGTSGEKEILRKIGRHNKSLVLSKDIYSFSQDMTNLVDDIKNSGIHNFALCEAGTSFGYDDLVVDMRSINIMQQLAPVFFDASYAFNHSHVEKGFFDLSHKVSMASIAYGVGALGVAGIIMDILPSRTTADDTEPGMLTLGALPTFLKHLCRIDQCAKTNSFAAL